MQAWVDHDLSFESRLGATFHFTQAPIDMLRHACLTHAYAFNYSGISIPDALYSICMTKVHMSLRSSE